MFISEKEKAFIKRELSSLWNNVNTLYEGKRQMNNLFTKDSHGTVRPKVDLVAESVEKVNTNMWIEVGKLHERIRQLEKK